MLSSSEMLARGSPLLWRNYAVSETEAPTPPRVVTVPDKRLVISDTPGTNAMRNKLAQNCEVAVTLNYAPVSRLLIVVKADTTHENSESEFYVEVTRGSGSELLLINV